MNKNEKIARGSFGLLILSLSVVITSGFLLTGCDKSHLAKVNDQQLTSEEQANVIRFLQPAKHIAEVLQQFDEKALEAANSNSPELANVALAQATASLAQVRVQIHKIVWKESEWTTVLPESMQPLEDAMQKCRDIYKNIRNGNYVSDDELISVYRNFRDNERAFRELTTSRPKQPANSASANVEIYVTLRGVPITYELTNNEVYLGPTVAMGFFDVNPVLRAAGSSNGATTLRRLVVRDPRTRTQRVWMLNNRMPRLSVPASYIETKGTDLVITPH